MKMSLLCVPLLKGLWAALGCPIEFDWGDAPDKFPKKAEKLFFFFLKHLLLSFGSRLSAGLQRPDLETAWCWLFCKLVLQLKQGPPEKWVLQPTVFIAAALCL